MEWKHMMPQFEKIRLLFPHSEQALHSRQPKSPPEIAQEGYHFISEMGTHLISLHMSEKRLPIVVLVVDFGQEGHDSVLVK